MLVIDGNSVAGYVIMINGIELVLHEACGALHTCQTDRSFRRRLIPAGASQFPQGGGTKRESKAGGPIAAAMPEEEFGIG